MTSSLLAAKGGHRIEARGAARGYQAGNQRDRQQ
jgi:hypothetical protein